MSAFRMVVRQTRFCNISFTARLVYAVLCLQKNFCLSFAGRFEADVEMIIRVHLLAYFHSIREDLKQRAVYLIFMRLFGFPFLIRSLNSCSLKFYVLQ